jgi:hypothetical protein
VRYWKSYYDHLEHYKLAKLTIQLFETVANSVAPERAFPAMGMIITKLQKMLGTEKANKLLYVYLNQRVLDKHGDILLGDWVDKTDKDQVDLEELLLAIEAES